MTRPSSIEPLLRIGELGRRVGLSPDRLRAWERRYELLQPTRTAGGFRLYSARDEARVRNMLAYIEQGLSAAEAARLAVAGTHSSEDGAAAGAAQHELADALAAFDDVQVNAILDRTLASRGVEATMRDLIYPSLRELGDAWARAELHVGQEHFAANLLQRRLLGMMPADESHPATSRVVLACPPGEHHVLGLIGLGVALRRRRCRVTLLGADTPIDVLARTADAVAPHAIVLAATMPHCAPAARAQIHMLARTHRVLLAGAGASPAVATEVGAQYLDTDPVSAAGFVAPPSSHEAS
jgi:DNA-binding transcriptional MerR regulator